MRARKRSVAAGDSHGCEGVSRARKAGNARLAAIAVPRHLLSA
jgi:hypothetical protein